MSCGRKTPSGLCWRPQIGGEPTQPPSRSLPLASRGNASPMQVLLLGTRSTFSPTRGREAPEGGCQGAFRGHPGVCQSHGDWVPPPLGQTPFSRPGCISDCCRTLAPVLSLTAGLQRGPPGSTPSEPSGTHQEGILGSPSPLPRGRLPAPHSALAQLTWPPGSPAGFTCGFPGAPALLLTPPDLRGGWASSSALNALLSCICSASRDRAKRRRPGGKEGSCFHQPLTSCPGPPCGPPAPSVNQRWE